MPKQTLSFEPGGPARVEIEWGMFWKNMRVRVDGQEVGTIAGKVELRKGKDFPLADGSLLQVVLTSGMQPMLHVTRDGDPLPGSATDPDTLAKAARGIVYFIAGFNILLGVVALLLDIGVLNELGLGVGSIIYGGVFLGLGLLVHLRGSWVALVVAALFFSIDAVATLGLSVSDGHSPGIGGIIFRVFLIAGMVRGIKPLYEAKQLARPDVGDASAGAGSPLAVPVRDHNEASDR